MPPSGSENASMVAITVGILEVQGAFLEHRVALYNAAKSLNHKIDLRIVEVRTSDDVKQELDGLIIPGGESTTISIYLKRNKMEESLQSWIADKRHVTWGTCAGMILLSKLTENQKLGGQSTLGIMDVDVSRNYFGRQIHSFEAPVKIIDKQLSDETQCDVFPGVFIRAPAVVKTLSTNVQILATINAQNTGNDVIVAAQQENVFSTAFHPELTDNCMWHKYFLSMVLKSKGLQT